MLFQGATIVSLDAKGRLAIPTKHREGLVAGGLPLVLTAHPDGCLLLYPRQAFEPVAAEIHALSSFNEQVRWWQRLLTGFAEDVEPDSSGRVLISPALRKFAKLNGKAVFVGQGNHFEIWEEAIWDEKLVTAMAHAASAPPPGAENFRL